LTALSPSLPSVPPGSQAGHVPMRLGTRRSGIDRAYRRVVWAAGAATFLVLFAIGLFLFIKAWPAFRYMGFSFFTTTEFQTRVTHSEKANFGVLAALYGSIVIAVIAVIVAVPVSFCTALFVNEYAPRSFFGLFPLRSFLISTIDLMAAVPSIIYGLWGFFVLSPPMANVSRFLSNHLSFVPFFRVPKGTIVFNNSYLIAGTLVAVMIMPIVTSITREMFSLTPQAEREGALALGATRARVIRDVIVPFAKGGMVGAVMLGLGRALGEAVAVSIILSLVFGVSIEVAHSGGLSIAALIASRFDSGGTYGTSALLACGLVLFVFTLIVNTIASIIVSRSRVG